MRTELQLFMNTDLRSCPDRITSFIVMIMLTAAAACSRQPIYPPPAVVDGNAVFDLSSLKPESPQFFTYVYHDKNISFFVIRMNGGVQSYLDACVTCYPKKRGYQDKNGYVACRACDMSFSVYKLEKGLGGCYPVKISGRMEKGNYLISLATLEGQADKF
jgi:uncharacterized membrane protein